MTEEPYDKIICPAGGFQDEAEIQCSTAIVDTNQVCAHQEEADTGMILHCPQWC